MKKRKKVLMTVLTIAIFGFVLTYNFYNENPKNLKEIKSKVAIADLDEITKSVDYKKFLISQYGYDYEKKLAKNANSSLNAQKIEESLIGSKSDGKLYPNYYGGMYINDNNDLVLQVVKNNIPSKNSKDYSAYNSVLNVDENAIIEYVDNSYNDLETINNKIIEYFSSNTVEYEYLIGNYIDIYNNSVVVELKNNTLQEQEKFREQVINSNFITFIKGKTMSATANTYYAGQNYQRYKYRDNGSVEYVLGKCSIGYRAKRNGVYGFVTAGHCVLDYEYTEIGVTRYCTYGQSMDAAFVEADSGNIISNTLQYTNSGAYTIYRDVGRRYYVGTNIAKVGAATSYQAGKVSAFNYSGNYTDGSYHTGLVKASIYINEGDSGGPVFIPSSSGGRQAYLIGITIAGSNDGTQTLFYDYVDIKAATGAEIY